MLMATIFKIPEDVSPAAAAFIRNVVALLRKLGLYDRADVGGLHMLCYDFAMYEMAVKDIMESGLWTTDSKQNRKPSPSVQIASTMQTQIIKLLREFGLTSKARASLLRADAAESTDAAPWEID